MNHHHFLSLALFCACAAAFARDVKVSFYAYDRLHEVAEDGSRGGMGYEFFERLAQKAAWTNEYVGIDKSWGDMQAMVASGEVEVLDVVHKVPGRETQYDYSALPMGYSCGFAMVRENENRFAPDDFSNWGRVRFGCQAGDRIATEFLDLARTYGFEAESVPFATEAKAAEALRDGQVDMLVLDSMTSVAGFRIVGEFNPRPYFVCVKKGNAELMDEINRAMAALYAENPNWGVALRSRHFPGRPVKVYLPKGADDNPKQARYLQAVASHLANVGGWAPTFVECKEDFSDVDASQPCIVAYLRRTDATLEKFDFPLMPVCRRFVYLAAAPEDKRFAEGLPKSFSTLRIGYARSEKACLEQFREYAGVRGLSYQLFPFDTEADLRRMVLSKGVDLALLEADANESLQIAELCGCLRFDFATPKSQPAFRRSLDAAIRHVRYHEAVFLQSAERYAFGNITPSGKLVRVGAYVEPGLSELDRFGETSGFVADYLREIARRKDWDVHFIPMTYPEAQTALAVGEVDVIGAAVHAPEREKYYDFSQRDIGPLRYALLTRRDSSYLPNRPDTWNGARIGYLAGSRSTDNLRKYLLGVGIDCTLVAYDDMRDAETDVRRGELNACFTLMSRHSDDLRPIAFRPTDLTYFCTNRRKGWIKEDIDSAMEEIVRSDPGFETRLRNECFPVSRTVLSLDPDEQEFVKNCQGRKIVIGFPEAVPPVVSFDEETGEAAGFLPALFSKIAEESGLSFEFVRGGKSDVYVSQLDSPYARKDLVAEEKWFPLPSARVTLISDDISDAVRGIVAVESHRKKEIEFLRESGLTPLVAATSLDCYRAVAEGRAEYTIDNVGSARRMIDGHNEFRLLHYLRMDPFLWARYVSVATPTSADPRLRSILRKTLATIRPDDVEKMFFDATFADRKETYAKADIVRGTVIATVIVLLLVVAILALALFRIRHEQGKTESARLERDAEAKLRKTIASQKSELERQQRDLQAALDSANAANRAKTAFLNSVSRDIRTPLTAIVGYAGLAASRKSDPLSVSDYIARIGRAGDHMLTVVNDVLDMGRIEAGKMELHSHPENLPDMLLAVRDMTAEDAKAKGLDVSVDTTAVRDPRVLCDRLRLSQVLLNLVSNAIKYTPDGGRIGLSAKQTDCEAPGFARYEIRVKDSGVGMTPEIAKTIFDSFMRESPTTISGIQGNGLGMALSKGLVRMMGGTIVVADTEMGKGTEILMTLDLRVADENTDDPESKPEEDEGTALWNKRRILLVEDNEINRDVATMILQELGCDVETAENGQVAVGKVLQTDMPYDLIFMDIQMPVMDGYEATRRLRSAGCRTPIVAMTANAFAEDREKALRASMNDHVAKPVRKDYLREILERYA